jgi:PilZ domain
MRMNETSSERRTSPRHRVFKGGRLAFPGGGAVDCVVRNISSSGARIDVANPRGLPEVFTLVIAADQFKRRCHSVWCHDKQIGVAFEEH